MQISLILGAEGTNWANDFQLTQIVFNLPPLPWDFSWRTLLANVHFTTLTAQLLTGNFFYYGENIFDPNLGWVISVLFGLTSGKNMWKQYFRMFN